MQGRKPKPTALKLITGNPGKRPIRFDEFKPAAGIPRCPKHVKGEAKKEWQRITSELMRYGMVTEIDRGLLAMICTTWAKYVEAEEMIEKARAAGGSGLFVKTPNGFPVVSPWMVVSNKAIEMYKSLCAEHCLTQATRARATPGDMQGDLFGIEGGKAPEGFASL